MTEREERIGNATYCGYFQSAPPLPWSERSDDTRAAYIRAGEAAIAVACDVDAVADAIEGVFRSPTLLALPEETRDDFLKQARAAIRAIRGTEVWARDVSIPPVLDQRGGDWIIKVRYVNAAGEWVIRECSSVSDIQDQIEA